MRIISGKYKGRVIKMPKGIRPTQNKARKALFDILGDIQGLSFLDLFAGSGAVGIEALSGGAGEVAFVENNQACIDTIKGNLAVIRLAPSPVEWLCGYAVIRLDVSKALEQIAIKKKKFDFIFMDPPYYQEIAKKTLLKLSSCDILAANGFVVVQHFKKDDLPEASGDLVLFKQSRYGDSVLSFYKKCAN